MNSHLDTTHMNTSSPAPDAAKDGTCGGCSHTGFLKRLPNILPAALKFLMVALLSLIELVLSLIFLRAVLDILHPKFGLEIPRAVDMLYSLGMMLLRVYALLILLSILRRLLPLSKYGLLILGLLCLGADLLALGMQFTSYGGTTVELRSLHDAEFGSYELPLSVQVFPLVVMGLDCLLRYVCCLRFGSAVYLLSLWRSVREGWRGVAVFVPAVAVYWGIFALYLSYILNLR